MRFKLPDIHNSVDKDRPFEHDRLEREQYAKILTEIVRNVEGGLVMSINNKWGTGKTTFIRMWEGMLQGMPQGQEFKTIYFNAWENDFEKNALAAILGELKQLTENGGEETFKKVLKNSAVIAGKMLPALVKGFLAQKFGKDTIEEVFKAAADGVVELVTEEVEDYAKKKASVEAFQTKLGEFVQETCGDKPLIFIVDELDRCRPDYAVEVLEQIKHFFSVPDIIFILSIDKDQLANAVRGYYGSDKIDAPEYLRRFIDFEYSIPEPDTRLFCEYVIDTLQFNEFFNSQIRLSGHGQNVFKVDQREFLEMAVLIFSSSQLPLRVIEKILIHARLALLTFAASSYVFPDVLIVLLYIRICDNELWGKLKNKQLKVEELIKVIDNLFNGLELSSKQVDHVLFMEALMIVLYNNYTNELNGKDLVKLANPEGEHVNQLRSEFSTQAPKKLFDYIQSSVGRAEYSRTPLSFLLTRIDLVQTDNQVDRV